MSILLDTHVLLWSVVNHRRLTAQMRELLDTHQVYISSLSCFEIQQKRAVKRLHGDIDFKELFDSGMFIEMPFNYHHAEVTYQLPLIHRDPFDRMLIAQSIVEGIPLVTSDHHIQQYDFEFIAV